MIALAASSFFRSVSTGYILAVGCVSKAADDFGLLLANLYALVSTSRFIGAFESVILIILGSLTTLPLLGENSTGFYDYVLCASVVTLALPCEATVPLQ